MVHKPVYACDFEGTRYDVGDKFGYVRATIDYALKRPDMSAKVKNYIKELARTF